MPPKQPPGKNTINRPSNNHETAIVQPGDDLDLLTDSITNAINNIATTTNNHPASQDALLTTLNHLADEQDYWRELLESGELLSKTWYVASEIEQLAETLPLYSSVQTDTDAILIFYTSDPNTPFIARAYLIQTTLSHRGRPGYTLDTLYSEIPYYSNGTPYEIAAIAIGLTLK